jgi:uncharacterized protein (TIGR00159 family)
MLNFLVLHFKDIIDVLLATFFIYVVILFLQQTKSRFIIGTFIVVIFSYFISKFFNLELSQNILQPLITLLAVIFVIVFQNDIRRFFHWISSPKNLIKTNDSNEKISEQIVSAVSEMAKNKVGALIVFPGKSPIDDIVQGGFLLDGKISTQVILSIFDTNTPGHDGAMLIENFRINKFGLHLPLAENFKNFSRMGTRHRAGIGITEQTDALAIIVSEERGEISIAKNGEIKKVEDLEKLLSVIKKYTHENADNENNKSLWNFIVVSNFNTKFIAFTIAIILKILLIK